MLSRSFSLFHLTLCGCLLVAVFMFDVFRDWCMMGAFSEGAVFGNDCCEKCGVISDAFKVIVLS